MLLSIELDIPDKSEIIAEGMPVVLANEGQKFSELQLGPRQKERGVYIIHHRGSIKYVGETHGRKMNFGVRLRRHFQASAAQRRFTYPKLEKLPPPIMVSLFGESEVDQMVRTNAVALSPVEKARILEQVLIALYKPNFQGQSP